MAAAAAAGSGVVQVSTDYVFDGAAGPYSEEDATNPLSHYGRMKLESESVVLEGDGPGLVVRTLWLFGHRPGARPNLVTWPLAALARGETVRVADDQWGNPTPAADLARALVELCRRGAAGLFHAGGASFMTRAELVGRVAALFQVDGGGLEDLLVGGNFGYDLNSMRCVRPIRCWSAEGTPASPAWTGQPATASSTSSMMRLAARFRMPEVSAKRMRSARSNRSLLPARLI